MLKGDFREAVPRELRVLTADLNGINIANIIHLNRLIFPVDETNWRPCAHFTRAVHALMRANVLFDQSVLLLLCCFSQDGCLLQHCYFQRRKYYLKIDHRQ